MSRKREKPMTDEEFAELEDDLATHSLTFAHREFEDRMREMWRTNPPAAAEYLRGIAEDMIESGALVQLPSDPHSKEKPRYILKAMKDIIDSVYAEQIKKERPSEYNPNGLHVMPKGSDYDGA